MFSVDDRRVLPITRSAKYDFMMCIASCILSKKRKLIELDIDAEWQVEGIMDSVHTDNGPDFRTNHISKACLKYGIHWEYRPIVGQDLAVISSMLGIVNLEMHVLDGTTFSNVQQRGLMIPLNKPV